MAITTPFCGGPCQQQQMNPCVPCINLDILPHSRIPFPFLFPKHLHPHLMAPPYTYPITAIFYFIAHPQVKQDYFPHLVDHKY